MDADKNFYGFTINMGYTTNKDVWERVQETQIHLDETESMEFVLAVRCFEQATHLLSVWVFVGSIS